MDDTPITIGERLRQRREALGLTRAELARRAGLPGESSVRAIEGGKRGPATATLAALAAQLGVAPEWLAFGTGPRAAAPRAA